MKTLFDPDKVFHHNQTKEFKYNCGLPGSNKTGAIVKVCDEWARRQKGSIHAVPSKQLCSEVYSRHNEPSIVLNSSTVSNVSSMLRHLVRDAKSPLIVTHHAIVNTDRIPVTNLTLFFDETFDPTIHVEINAESSLLRDCLVIPNISERYSLCYSKDESQLWKTIYSLRGDSFDECSERRSQIERLLTYISRYKHFDVWSHNTFNRNYFEGRSQKAIFTVIIRPEILYPWKSVRFSSAGFDESLLYHLWKNVYGVEWEVDEKMMSYLIPVSKPSVRVYYWSDRGWSKSFRNTVVEEKSLLSQYYRDVECLLNEIGVKRVLLSKNKDDTESLEEIEVEIAPYKSEGLNSFITHDTYIECGAFNKPNSYYEFMKFLGLQSESHSSSIEKVYQTLYRTRIRENPNALSNLIIPSKILFPPYLSQRFQSAELIAFGNLSNELKENKRGRPAGKRMDPLLAERRIYIQNQKAKLAPPNSDDDFVTVTVFDVPTVIDDRIVGLNPQGDSHKFTRNQFYEYLTSLSKKTRKTKYDSLSFSLIEYEDNRRSIHTALRSFGCVFDFDTTDEQGHMTPEKIQDIIGYDVECFFYTTFSEGYKRRAVILYQNPISVREQVFLMNHLSSIIEDQCPLCKLDRKSVSVSQSWFFPSKTSTHVEKSGSLVFDPLSYIYGSIDQPPSTIPSSTVSNKSYDELISPLLHQMKDGNRFYLGQTAVGYCARYSSHLRDRLEQDFIRYGMKSDQVNDLMRFYDRIT